MNSAYIFIDASNLWEAQKAKGQLFDYEKLHKYLKGALAVEQIDVYYYTAYPAEGTRPYDLDGKHKFFTYLKKGLGFIVRKKKLKRIAIITEDGQSVEEKGNMDVEITIDAMHFRDRYDKAVFFTGDSDFLALISYLRRGGKKVYVYSSRNNISQELRTSADDYIDVLNIEDDIWGNALQHKKLGRDTKK